jgi:hypothetical protein
MTVIHSQQLKTNKNIIIVLKYYTKNQNFSILSNFFLYKNKHTYLDYLT